MTIDQTIGYIATALFIIMFIPQIIKTLQTNCVKNVSLPMFILGFVANVFALIYSILINEHPLQLKYVVSLVVIGFYLIVYFSIRSKNNETA